MIARRAALAALLPLPALAAPQELRAADGLALTAELVAATAPRRGTLLLFHQAGSNLGEYAPIQPELARLGFDSLALDQRSGGDGWGRRNQTAARVGRDPGYRAALPDLQAALAWARGRDARGRVLVWGSSYSAALVFLLAAEAGPGVSALLAFSPGEYLAGVSVRAAAARVRCPAFVTSASDAEEERAAATLLEAVPGAPKRQHRARAGLHGSATLRADRNPRGAAENWAAVTAFLAEVAP
jgi:alpha-beta hydrolase superfamily lysophospholipase